MTTYDMEYIPAICMDRLRPSTMAAMISDLADARNTSDELDVATFRFVTFLRYALNANCGPDDAARYIAEAQAEL